MPGVRGNYRLITIPVLWICQILFLSGVSCTDCFKCTQAWSDRECLQNAPETCEWGEICSTTVEEGGIGGTIYTKGCMEANHCYSLEQLNHVTICKQDPSVCVYCCTGHLCNSAVTSYPVAWPYVVIGSLLFHR